MFLQDPSIYIIYDYVNILIVKVLRLANIK